jgi:hypothetical protein
MPLRAGRAGFFTTTNFAKPWSTKTPILLQLLVTDGDECLDDLLHVLAGKLLADESAMALRISLFERGLFFLVVVGFAMFAGLP